MRSEGSLFLFVGSGSETVFVPILEMGLRTPADARARLGCGLCPNDLPVSRLSAGSVTGLCMEICGE